MPQLLFPLLGGFVLGVIFHLWVWRNVRAVVQAGGHARFIPGTFLRVVFFLGVVAILFRLGVWPLAMAFIGFALGRNATIALLLSRT